MALEPSPARTFRAGLGTRLPRPRGADRMTAGAIDDVLHSVEPAPHGMDNHPAPDHILPLFVAMGVGSPPLHAERLHHSLTYGLLAMDVYAFD